MRQASPLAAFHIATTHSSIPAIQISPAAQMNGTNADGR